MSARQGSGFSSKSARDRFMIGSDGEASQSFLRNYQSELTDVQARLEIAYPLVPERDLYPRGDAEPFNSISQAALASQR
jgi:hypothetical protein